MSQRLRPQHHRYELLPRTSSDTDDLSDLERRESNSSHSSSTSWLGRLGYKIPRVTRLARPAACARYITPRRSKRSILRLIYYTAFAVPYFVVFLVLFVGLFFPSYTHEPSHYNELRQRAVSSTVPGRANIRNEKIFIAAAIYEQNGSLSSGAWGQSIMDLVDLLGPQNVHLSIFENDVDQLTQQSLRSLEDRAACNATVVSENLDLATLPRVTLPNGVSRIKRIAFLAEVRNRALAPLATSEVPFDKILYLNDVNFDPVDAANLLLSTNADDSGRANYDAACAVDFINGFKFYDRFATRDLEGADMGIPFYPWFTSFGKAESRNDVLSNKDAVRVTSCWGGMTAFAAKWFQDQRRFGLDGPGGKQGEKKEQEIKGITTPLRFRHDPDVFWESSECCLIHADLAVARSSADLPASAGGIYMNPFIRVAYDPRTLSWLRLTRRPERLYATMHNWLNAVVGFPLYNPRRNEVPGEKETDKIWVYEDPDAAFGPNATTQDRRGRWETRERIAVSGGFCGGAQLLVINEEEIEGEGKWSKIEVPRPP